MLRFVVTCNALYLFCRYKQEVLNYKIAARPERRRQFEKELTSQMEVALNILTACLSIAELKEQVTSQWLFYLLSIMSLLSIFECWFIVMDLWGCFHVNISFRFLRHLLRGFA